MNRRLQYADAIQTLGGEDNAAWLQKKMLSPFELFVVCLDTFTHRRCAACTDKLRSWNMDLAKLPRSE